jgi:Putative bacterial sensory transduction regulator
MTPTDPSPGGTRLPGPKMRDVLETCIERWVEDPDSSVEYAEEVEGRWAVRMRQETRDATTVWFSVGERSLEYEAYVLPTSDGPARLVTQALARNARSWRAFFALDREGGLVLRGRLPASSVTPLELDLVLGEIYETIEVSFRPLLRSMIQSRENST